MAIVALPEPVAAMAVLDPAMVDAAAAVVVPDILLVLVAALAAALSPGAVQVPFSENGFQPELSFLCAAPVFLLAAIVAAFPSADVRQLLRRWKRDRGRSDGPRYFPAERSSGASSPFQTPLSPSFPSFSPLA